MLSAEDLSATVDTEEEKYLIRELFITNQCDLQIFGCSFSESNLMTVEKWRANYSSFGNFQALLQTRLKFHYLLRVPQAKIFMRSIRN